MIYLLYNPYSMSGHCKGQALKLSKKLFKKGKINCIYSLVELEEKLTNFLSKLESKDEVILIGGDGTLHQIVNKIKEVEIPCKVYLYKCGSGNDFARGHKGRLFEITKEIKDLPTISYQDKKIVFLNGVGVGIDAKVCEMVNLNNKKDSYFKTAVKCFKTFKPYSLDLVVDGLNLHFDRVWFFVVNNGKYFGGGMKIAPKAVREDSYLDMVIVHSINFKKLLKIFPLIFIGKHVLAKKAVYVRTCQKVEASFSGCSVMQADGEVFSDIHKITIER